MSTEGQAAEPTKDFVRRSTDQSVADGVPSVLACLEVVVAVGAYGRPSSAVRRSMIVLVRFPRKNECAAEGGRLCHKIARYRVSPC